MALSEEPKPPQRTHHHPNALPHEDEKGIQASWIVDRIPFLFFLAALMFVGFVLGTMVTIAEVSPSGYFKNAYKAGTALYEKFTTYHDPLATDLWTQARTPQSGVTVYDPQRAADGLTLYASGHASHVFLIDMQGRVVHEWERPYSTVWDKTAAVRNPVPDDRTSIQKTHLFPNGDLVAIYIGVGDTPYGYGIVKLDRNSEVIWKNLDYFHHDFAVGPDGRIYGLTQDFRTEFPEGVDHLSLPVLDDFVAILSPDGRTLKKISLLDAVNKSAFRRLLWLVPYYSLADPLHTNGIDMLDEATAAKLKEKIPVAAPGQLLLSFRELGGGGSIALLDIASEKIVWATRGPWHAQHDPDFLPNGNLLMFDNRGHFGPGGDSRVIEYEPGSGKIAWHYAGTPERPFNSYIRSDQERLPNGNTLITESDGGRLLEVTADGQIVWEFVNPVRGGEKAGLIAILTWATRIDAHALDDDFRAGIEETKISRRY